MYPRLSVIVCLIWPTINHNALLINSVTVVLWMLLPYTLLVLITNRYSKMNKWKLLVAACTLSMTAVHATPNYSCGYKDYFRLSDTSHPGIFIVSSYADQDIYLQVIGPRSFLIRDMPRCQSGYAHVTVAYDAANWCVLDIKDGPWLNHPTVSASCNGIRYLETTYDGFGSYSYTINLD